MATKLTYFRRIFRELIAHQNPMKKMRMVISALSMFAMVSQVHAFYLPGVAPRTFKEGQNVQIKVQTLVSSESQLQFDYYQLPFCKPEHVVDVPENLGEALTGDKAHTSAFEARMRVNEYCKTLCRKEYTAQQVAHPEIRTF
jgi:transmembrane 9 superfamily protein 2/4